MAEHTPIPWRRNGHFVETATKPPFAVCDVYGDGQILQEVGDLIVRAVNCHEELVEALEDFLADWDSPNFRTYYIDEAHVEAARTALAKAKEAHLQQRDLEEETL